jgi:hypothetical protein
VRRCLRSRPELPALPGLAAEEAAGHGRADRFRTWVAIAIALVSILGAVVAFSGTLAEQEARHLDQQGIQDAARQQRCRVAPCRRPYRRYR